MKKKSLLVAIVSSFVICVVLVLTLIGYLVYLELKDKELRGAYQQMLHKVNAKLYARHIAVTGLTATLESTGALKGKPVIHGTLNNKGYKDVSDILMLIRFMDKDKAVLYEVVFHPQDPSLGTGGLSQAALNYIAAPQKNPIKPGASFTFKKILTNCPKEILSELRKSESGGAWKGTLESEILSVSF